MTAVARGGTVTTTLPPLAASVTGIKRYGAKVNTHDLIKVVAIVTMVIDHASWAFMDDNIWMRLVGRAAAPLFFYLVGYSGSYRFKNQILALGVALFLIRLFTPLPAAPHSMLWQILPINILITFVLIKAIMNRFDPVKMSTPSLIILLACLLAASPSAFVVDYGTLGLAIAIGARLINQRHPFGRTWIIIATVFYFSVMALAFLFSKPEVPMPDVPMHIVLLGLLVLAVIASMTILLFLRYRLRTFTVNPAWLKNTIIYISRYSLQIFFFHIAAFMIICRYV